MDTESIKNLIRIQKTIRGFLARKRLIASNKLYAKIERRKNRKVFNNELDLFDFHSISENSSLIVENKYSQVPFLKELNESGVSIAKSLEDYDEEKFFDDEVKPSSDLKSFEFFVDKKTVCSLLKIQLFEFEFRMSFKPVNEIAVLLENSYSKIKDEESFDKEKSIIDQIKVEIVSKENFCLFNKPVIELQGEHFNVIDFEPFSNDLLTNKSFVFNGHQSPDEKLEIKVIGIVVENIQLKPVCDLKLIHSEVRKMSIRHKTIQKTKSIPKRLNQNEKIENIYMTENPKNIKKDERKEILLENHKIYQIETIENNAKNEKNEKIEKNEKNDRSSSSSQKNENSGIKYDLNQVLEQENQKYPQELISTKPSGNSTSKGVKLPTITPRVKPKNYTYQEFGFIREKEKIVKPA